MLLYYPVHSIINQNIKLSISLNSIQATHYKECSDKLIKKAQYHCYIPSNITFDEQHLLKYLSNEQVHWVRRSKCGECRNNQIKICSHRRKAKFIVYYIYNFFDN